MPVRSFIWGIESWEMGINDFLVEFVGGPVRILKVKGNATAAPQPNHQPFAQIIRQSIATLINVGAVAEHHHVKIISTPQSRANHSISSHLFSLNVKQVNGNAVRVPVDFDFSEDPIILTQAQLRMNIFNESYKMQDSIPVASKDQNDILNLEMHLSITYESE